MNMPCCIILIFPNVFLDFFFCLGEVFLGFLFFFHDPRLLISCIFWLDLLKNSYTSINSYSHVQLQCLIAAHSYMIQQKHTQTVHPRFILTSFIFNPVPGINSVLILSISMGLFFLHQRLRCYHYCCQFNFF